MAAGCVKPQDLTSLRNQAQPLRRTGLRDSAVPFPQQHPCEPQSVLTQIYGNKGHFLGYPHVISVCEEFNGLQSLKKWVTLGFGDRVSACV